MSTQGVIQSAALLLSGGVIHHMLSRLWRRPAQPVVPRAIDAMPRADISPVQSHTRVELDLLSDTEVRVLRRLEVGSCLTVDLLKLAELEVLDAMQLAQLLEVLPNTMGRLVASITPRGRQALEQRAGSPESVYRAETVR